MSFQFPNINLSVDVESTNTDQTTQSYDEGDCRDILFAGKLTESTSYVSAAANTDVWWPGGTQPDNTASGHDIYSFYWDHLRQICFGVASLAFAAPS